MAMATLFSDTSFLFSRSKSSPKLSELSDPIKHNGPGTRVEDIQRSASFTGLHDLSSFSFRQNKQTLKDLSTEVSETSSTESLSQRKSRPQTRNDAGQEKPKEDASKEFRPKLDRTGRRKSLVGSLIQKVRGSPDRSLSTKVLHDQNGAPKAPANTSQAKEQRSRSTLSQLSRSS